MKYLNVCHPCAGAMLIFSISFQLYQTNKNLRRVLLGCWSTLWLEKNPPQFFICLILVPYLCTSWQRNFSHAEVPPASFHLFYLFILLLFFLFHFIFFSFLYRTRINRHVFWCLLSETQSEELHRIILKDFKLCK